MTSNSDNFTIKEMVNLTYKKLDILDEKHSIAVDKLNKIEVHLRELNGSVLRNAKDIKSMSADLDEHKKSIGKINLTLAKWAGSIGVIVFIVTFIANNLL